MTPPLAVEWRDLKKGQVYSGTITRLEKFGAFVDIGAEKEGLVHISELSHDYVRQPSEAVSVGDEVQVQVLGFNRRKRRIDLSRKAMLESPADAELAADDLAEAAEEEEDIEMPTAMEIALRRAMDQSDETAAAPSKSKKRSKRNRDQQEDILSRTLKLSQEAPE
jgi:predicted RNA-binding protein with RPS1 domain